MGPARPAPAPLDAMAGFLDGVLGMDSVETSLALGLETIARLCRAEVAAILPVEAGDPRLETWHPDEAAARERYRPSFVAAAESARGGTPRAAPCGEAPRIIPLVAAGTEIGSLCLSGGEAAHLEAALPVIPRMAAVIACLAAAKHEATRSTAMKHEYERWFKTLDNQIRVLERERQKFAAIVHRSDAEVFVADRAGLIRWTNVLLASHAPPGPAGGGWIGMGCRAVCSRFSAEDAPPAARCSAAVFVDPTVA